MKSYKKPLLFAIIVLGFLSMPSCRKKEGCYTEEYYRTNAGISKRKSHRKSELFSKKHRKRMKKKHGKSY